MAIAILFTYLSLLYELPYFVYLLLLYLLVFCLYPNRQSTPSLPLPLCRSDDFGEFFSLILNPQHDLYENEQLKID